MSNEDACIDKIAEGIGTIPEDATENIMENRILEYRGLLTKKR